MAWRKAHGQSAKGGRIVAIETLPADELPSASGPNPARQDRDAAGRFLPGNSLARNAKFRSGKQGELGKLERKGDPAWQASDRWSKQWAAHRRTELANLHGGELSSEVCSLVEDARQALSDARYCRALAAGEQDPKRAQELRSEARQLRIEARGHRLAAWEIAAKEAAARPKQTGKDRLLARMAAVREARGESDD